MKKLYGHIAALALLVIVGCTGQDYPPSLIVADSLLQCRPDSALAIADSLLSDSARLSRGQLMRCRLLRLSACNKLDTVFTAAHAAQAEALADYFDRHGTSNEQLRAHYILGRTYADMGETPRAVDCYLDAIAKADTAANDCDYRTLSSSYSQMADLFHRQLLLTQEIESRRKAANFAQCAGLPLFAISDMKLSAGAYIQLNKRDTAEVILKEVMRLYQKHGHDQESIRASMMLMYLYAQQPGRLDNLKQLVFLFDTKSDLFDEKHELHGMNRQFYLYKGQYFEAIDNLDSAEYYYRKIHHHNAPPVGQVPMYRSLLNIFTKRHEADSIAKYAQLYCVANDSSVILDGQQMTAQLAASYSYNIIQKEAKEKEEEIHRQQLLIIAFFFLLIVGVLWGYHYRVKQQGKQEKLRKDYQKEQEKKQMELERLQVAYADATVNYEQNLHALQLLKDSHQQVIRLIKAELDTAQTENVDFKTRYEAAQRDIDQLNTDYERNKSELKKENAILLQKIEEMKRQGGLSKQLEKSKQYGATNIAMRVKEKAKSSQYVIQEDEWKELQDTASKYYPELIYDLNHVKGTTPQKMRACILYILHLRTSDVANFLGVKPERATNLKGDLNMALFNDTSARTFFKNLAQRYDIYIN